MNNEFPVLMDDAIGKERPPIEKLEKTFLLIEWYLMSIDKVELKSIFHRNHLLSEVIVPREF